MYTVSQKKEATLIFDINSPHVEIFYHFEALCSGLISAMIRFIQGGPKSKPAYFCNSSVYCRPILL